MAAVTTAAATVAAALSVVGQTETPPGSNSCVITRELDANFPRINGATRSGTAWCGSYALWALWKGGYPIDPRGGVLVNGVFIASFYTPADVNGWKRADRWLDWRETPPVGAFVYYDWEGTHGTTSVTDHVGIVTAVSADGSVISTVEGNTSPAGFVSEGGGVYTFGPGQQAPARPRSMIVGFGLPQYTDAPIPTTPEDEDMALIMHDDLGNYFRVADSVRNVGTLEIAQLRATGAPEVKDAAVGWEAWNLRNQAGVTPNPTPA